MAFDRLEENYQGIDWEKFSSGNYALMGRYPHMDESRASRLSLYDIGETIQIKGDSGKIIEYELLGYIEFPYAMSCQHSHFDGFDIIVPADSFPGAFGEQAPMSLIFDVEDEHRSDTENMLQALTEKQFTNLEYRSKAYYMNEFSSMQNTFMILGGVITVILAMTGLLNFINTTATSIMTRKREFAMLVSVGMTGRQLKRMLFLEGLWYAVLALGFALTAGAAIGAALLQGIAANIWFFSFLFTVSPILICAPVLLALCALIPLICEKALGKESIVERLREE
jgi:putative ABC transport system permease protein